MRLGLTHDNEARIFSYIHMPSAWLRLQLSAGSVLYWIWRTAALMGTRASTEPGQALSPKEPTGASAGDLPPTTTEKQTAQVQVLKSLPWVTCLGVQGTWVTVRESGKELELGFERCLGWHERRAGAGGQDRRRLGAKKTRVWTEDTVS